MPTSIRKVVVTAYGDESKITIVHDELPDPPANYVQLRIIYTGFSGTDINMRRGVYPESKPHLLLPDPASWAPSQ
jgi:threonine dehydrogenase-like Zn-dependent dehydrogenase